MELTQEQQNIINSTGNIKINAVAGSGKTTTVIEYAKTRSAESKILYLAFNKSVKLEAQKKFSERGLTNVVVETAHSLAYRYIFRNRKYKLKNQGYRTNEIVECLKLTGDNEKHTEYIIANHINKLITYFCNSDKEKVQDLNYLDTIKDAKAKKFVTTFYDYILKQARIFLGKMDKAEIDITHDFYLKKFQLSKEQLNYDYILFDEGQDASAAMLDVFFNQKATKVIVGDTHQQIYGWRYAVNSLEKANFETFHLSTSFRFSQDIADLAMETLALKTQISTYKAISIFGRGNAAVIKSKAILARTNLGLLLKAIKHIKEKKKVKHIYFEGNINSYTYADEGASLYDVLNLFNRKHYLIKDKLIKSMKDLNELEDYIDKTEDVQLAMMVEIVKEYGNEIPEIINLLKKKHVDNNEREKAEIIFSTVHRCKGMEYDTIELVDDFLSEEKLEKLIADKKNKEIDPAKLNEEINLLYVAITRTKNSIHIPESLVPPDFPESPHIHILNNIEDNSSLLSNKVIPKSNPKQSIAEIKVNNKDAYTPWNDDLDNELTILFCQNIPVKEIAKQFGRTVGAINSRIKKLELRELYG